MPSKILPRESIEKVLESLKDSNNAALNEVVIIMSSLNLLEK
jgi:hypothetical protein